MSCASENHKLLCLLTDGTLHYLCTRSKPEGCDMANGGVGISEEYGFYSCGHHAKFNIDNRGCARNW